MIRLNADQLKNRVEIVNRYMSLEGSSYNLETGEVKIQSLTGIGGYRKQSYSKDGYAFYSLRDGGKSYTIYLHHIVMMLADAEEYIKQMAQGMTINHISGDKTDNRLSNLEYLSNEDNIIHAYIIGLSNKPLEDKVSEYEAYEMLEGFYQSGRTLEELSEAFNIPVSSVKNIVIGKGHRAIFAMFKALNRSQVAVVNKSGASKLNAVRVKNILREYAQGASQQEIADKYNVARSTVGMIVTGQRWSEIYEEFVKEMA